MAGGRGREDAAQAAGVSAVSHRQSRRWKTFWRWDGKPKQLRRALIRQAARRWGNMAYACYEMGRRDNRREDGRRRALSFPPFSDYIRSKNLHLEECPQISAWLEAIRP